MSANPQPGSPEVINANLSKESLLSSSQEIVPILVAALAHTGSDFSQNIVLKQVLDFLRLQTSVGNYQGLSASDSGRNGTLFACIAESIPDFLGNFYRNLVVNLSRPDNVSLSKALLVIERAQPTEPVMAATIYGINSINNRTGKAEIDFNKRKQIIRMLTERIPDLSPASRTVQSGNFYTERQIDLDIHAVRNSTLAAAIAFREAKNIGDNETAEIARQKLLEIAKNIGLSDEKSFIRFYRIMIYTLRDAMSLYYDLDDDTAPNKVDEMLGLMGEVAYSLPLQKRFDKMLEKASDTDNQQIIPILSCLRTIDLKVLLKYITNKSPIGKDTNITMLVEAEILSRSMHNVAQIGKIKGNLELLENDAKPIQDRIGYLVAAIVRGWPFGARIINLLSPREQLQIFKELGKQSDQLSLELFTNLSRIFSSFPGFPKIETDLDLNTMMIYLRQDLKHQASYGKYIGVVESRTNSPDLIDDIDRSYQKILELARLIERQNSDSKIDSFQQLQQILAIMACVLPDDSTMKKLVSESGENAYEPFEKFAKEFAKMVLNFAINPDHFEGEKFAAYLFELVHSSADTRLVNAIISQIRELITNSPKIYHQQPEKINNLFMAIGLPNSHFGSREEQEENEIKQHAVKELGSLINTIMSPADLDINLGEELFKLGGTISPEENARRKKANTNVLAAEHVSSGNPNYGHLLLENGRYLGSLYVLNKSFLHLNELCKTMGFDLGSHLMTFVTAYIATKISDIKTFESLASTAQALSQITSYIQDAIADIEAAGNDNELKLYQVALDIAQRMGLIGRDSSVSAEQLFRFDENSNQSIKPIYEIVQSIVVALSSGNRASINEYISAKLRAEVKRIIEDNNPQQQVEILELQALATQLVEYKVVHQRLFGQDNSHKVFEEIAAMLSEAIKNKQ